MHNGWFEFGKKDIPWLTGGCCKPVKGINKQIDIVSYPNQNEHIEIELKEKDAKALLLGLGYFSSERGKKALKHNAVLSAAVCCRWG